MAAVLQDVQYIENTQDCCEGDLNVKEENNDNLTNQWQWKWSGRRGHSKTIKEIYFKRLTRHAIQG